MARTYTYSLEVVTDGPWPEVSKQMGLAMTKLVDGSTPPGVRGSITLAYTVEPPSEAQPSTYDVTQDYGGDA